MRLRACVSPSRGSVCSVLLTCCKDSVCRVWAETLLPDDSLLSSHHSNEASPSGPCRKSGSNERSPGNASLQLNLQESCGISSFHGVAHPSVTGCQPHLHGRHYSHKSGPNNVPHANALCHFHIAASINPATDIPLLPSITSLCGGDVEEPGGPFTVHWLNNKELSLTLAMEPEDEEHSEDGEPGSTDPPGGSETASMELPAAAVEHQVELLLAEWNKGADMLFSIHPMDGSLLVWNVDWLDEYQPAMYRQAHVSVSVSTVDG
ncbi:hypothetical protein CRUP_006754 [Coryphaenoides rupestris]|nr:hypothetical protein CRUP_006754 [Coryphaenoides rupestris]